MDTNTKPSVILKNGRKVYPGQENEDYYFFNTHLESTAHEILSELLKLGYDASIGHGFGHQKNFVRVKRNK